MTQLVGEVSSTLLCWWCILASLNDLDSNQIILSPAVITQTLFSCYYQEGETML